MNIHLRSQYLFVQKCTLCIISRGTLYLKENNKCMWKKSLCLDWMKYGSYHLISCFPCNAYSTQIHVFLVSWINSACPFQYHSGCALESDVFRWILLRMRDPDTSKRLTASGSSLISIFLQFCTFFVLLLFCDFFWTLRILTASWFSFNSAAQ